MPFGRNRSVVALVLATAAAGLAGLAAVGFVLLRAMPEPAAAKAHALRRFGLVALGFAWAGGLAGGVAGFVLGLGHLATVAFAVLEVGVIGFLLAGVVGVVVGTLAGGADYCARTRAA